MVCVSLLPLFLQYWSCPVSFNPFFIRDLWFPLNFSWIFFDFSAVDPKFNSCICISQRNWVRGFGGKRRREAEEGSRLKARGEDVWRERRKEADEGSRLEACGEDAGGETRIIRLCIITIGLIKTSPTFLRFSWLDSLHWWCIRPVSPNTCFLEFLWILCYYPFKICGNPGSSLVVVLQDWYCPVNFHPFFIQDWWFPLTFSWIFSCDGCFHGWWIPLIFLVFSLSFLVYFLCFLCSRLLVFLCFSFLVWNWWFWISCKLSVVLYSRPVVPRW